MCQRCAKEVKEKGILDTDLPYLPYTEVWNYCIVPGCHGRCKLRDYGIAPYYYWPVKVRYSAKGFRGGWLIAFHPHMCSKHYKPIIKREMPIPDHSGEVCLLRIVPIESIKK